MVGGVKLEDCTLEMLREMSLVELAHEVMVAGNEPLYYRDLMGKVASLLQMDSTQVDDVIARLYTDVNIDGRFLCIGDNVWGLKRWYPTEKTTERSPAKKFLRKDLPEFDEDEDVLEVDEEELLDEDPPFTFDDEEEDGFDEDIVVEDEVDLEEADEVDEVDEVDELELEEEEEGEF